MSLVLLNEETRIAVRPKMEGKAIDHVPPHVYRISMSEEGLNLVKDRKNFTIPKQVYGKHVSYRDAILAEYKKTTCSLGVILRGIKGAGKSLLAEDLANYCLKMDVPVLYVQSGVPVGLLYATIKIVGACVVYFDEYGKIYSDKEERARMLSMFSDTSFNKVLFILTGNDSDEFDENTINRPGRFKFCINYKYIDGELGLEILKKNKVPTMFHEYILRYISRHQVTFDIINTIVDITKNVNSVEEMISVMEIYNVPKPIYKKINIRTFLVNGEKFVGRVDIYSKDFLNYKLIAVPKGEIKPSISIDFNFDEVEKITEDEGQAWVNYGIKLSDECYLELKELWGIDKQSMVADCAIHDPESISSRHHIDTVTAMFGERKVGQEVLPEANDEVRRSLHSEPLLRWPEGGLRSEVTFVRKISDGNKKS